MVVPFQSPGAGAGDVGVASGVGVAGGVAVGVGVGVGPNNSPGPQLKINKFPAKIQMITVRCELFIVQVPALSRFMGRSVPERDQSARPRL